MKARVQVEGWLVRTVLVQFLVTGSIHMMRPMVSYRALELGAGALDLGIVAASFAALPFVFAVPMGHWVDRFGEPRFLTVGAFGIFGVAVWLLWIGSIPALIAAQALMGLAQLAHNVGLQTLLANAGDPNRRDSRIALYSIIQSLGQMAGPLSAGFIAGAAANSVFAVFWVAAGAGLIATIAAITIVLRPPVRSQRRRQDGAKGEGARKSLSQVVKIPSVPLALMASMLVIGSGDVLIVYLPAYGEANGISVEMVGVLLSVRAGASIVSRVLLLPMIHRVGRHSLFVASLLIPGIALLPLLTSPPVFVLFAIMAIAGFTLGLGQPLSLAWLAARVTSEMRGLAFGLRVSANRGSQFLLPAILGGVASLVGFGGMFFVHGLILSLSSISVMRGNFAETEVEDDDASPPQSRSNDASGPGSREADK